MSEFISWIEKDGDVIFLTGDDLRSRRGREMVVATGEEDIPGHGAIKWFYNLMGGVNQECTDFSDPCNFPEKIVQAIKNGEMAHPLFGTFPKDLLTDVLYGDYLMKLDALCEDYWAKHNILEKDYWTKCNILDEEYEVKRKVLNEDHRAKRNALYEEYEASRKALDEDYWMKHKALDKEAWNLFSVLENRKEAWK